MTQHEPTSTDYTKNSSQKLSIIDIAKQSIEQFLNRFKFVRKIKYDEDIKKKDKQFREMKQKLESNFSTIKLLNEDLRLKAQENALAAEHWKERLRYAGSPGVPAIERKKVVAGPYFCEPGSLERLKEPLTAFFSEALGSTKLPNKRQWEMILSENPLTCVNAGAGSGKSTTLILRVYVMRKYMKIPWDEISIFTFSKNSQMDLLEKLIQTFRKLGENVDEREAKDVVRTFHSYVLSIDKTSGNRDKTILEMISKSKVKKHLITDSSPQSDLEEDTFDVHNPLTDMSKEDKASLNLLLKEIYHVAFTKSEVFRSLIRRLYLHQMTAKKGEKEVQDIVFIQNNDKEVTDSITSMFCKDSEVDDVLDLNVARYYRELNAQLYLNAEIKSSGHQILFIPEEQYTQNFVAETSVTVGSFLKAKQKKLMETDKPLLQIRNRRELIDLVKFLRHFSLEQCDKAPSFDYLPQGEFVSSAPKSTHIATRFFELIQFVQSYALDFMSWADNISLNERAANDSEFVAACRIYYEFYLEYLKEKKYRSFNQMFLEIQPKKLCLIDDKIFPALKKVKHVFIDEFQDITPLYAYFIQAIKYTIASKTDQAGSMMVVGDDFQSIYGWKGSMVDFITKFNEKFHSYVDPLPIKMEVNHRCTQKIIDFAEAIIYLIDDDYRTDKRGRAAFFSDDDPLPRVFQISKSNYIDRIINLIKEEIDIIKPTEKEPIRVLSRGHTILTEIKKRFKNESVKFDTFHGSKGLEAKSVILIGDCFYSDTNPIKNDVLRQVLGEDVPSNEYDRMQEREALRLAYVAATRAEKRCYWILIENNGPKSTLRTLIEKSANFPTPLCEYIRPQDGTRLDPIPYKM